MLQLKNRSPFPAKLAVFPNEQAIDTIYVMVRAGFIIGQQWTLEEEQVDPQLADEYYGEPGESSLKMPSDYHTGKAATDIFMLGSACAPDRQSIEQLDVSLRVANLAKTVRVFGNRYWQRGRMTDPEPFETMRLRYEKAFGGADMADGVVRDSEVRNPVGAGFMGMRSVDEMDGFALPNLEDPLDLIQQYSDRPKPACFAPIAPNWAPRINYAGTYDENWQSTRAPFLPEDYSQQFMNCASSDLIYPGFMHGGEHVQIVNMHPSGPLQFQLPVVRLESNILLSSNKVVTVPLLMDSVILQPNELKVSMVWRASYSVNNVADITAVDVKMVR